MTHELKIWPKYFEAVEHGHKTFEYRKDDRGFSFGDTVILKEWDPTRNYKDTSLRQLHPPVGYTGRELKFTIGYILPTTVCGETGHRQVCFSLLPYKEPESETA